MRTDAFSFRHLQVVAAVARLGSVRSAVARVNLSQPAISQAIAGVERALGASLFDRCARGMFANDACQLFAQRIDRAIGYLASGAQSISPRKGTRPSGTPAISRLATTVQLRALVGVIEFGGYAPAARQLGVTQPNVHRAIRDLERITECQLFHPSRFGASPTPEALVLARCAMLAFREIELGQEEVGALLGVQNGSLLIGALPLIHTSILPNAVVRLLGQYPDAKIKIIDAPYAELLSHLRHGRLDLILGALRRPAPSGDLHQQELFKEPLAVVVRAGHPLLSCGVVNAAQLAEMEWVAPHAATPAGANFEAFFRRHELPLPRRVIECSSFTTTRDLLVRTNRAALLSASQIDDEALGGDLACVVPELPGTDRPIGVCTRSDWSPTKVQTRFLSLVREIAEESRPRDARAIM